jgi:ABC-type nitrate/sulfonate/bicarbonate transport system substrate-binding protein
MSMIGLRKGLFPICGWMATLLAITVAGAGMAQAQTKVVIGTAKDPNLGAQIIIARDKGFFKEQDLDAEVKYFPTGGDLMSGFVGGSVQMGSAGLTPVTLLRGRPYPVKVVAQISDISGAQQLIVHPEIKQLSQLEGKKVALLRGTSPEALWNAIVRAHKEFDPSKVEVINMGATEMIQAFTLGDVDAVILWEPHATRARIVGKGKILISGTHTYLDDNTVDQRMVGDHSLLFASDAFVRDNAATVRSVLAALAKANDFIDNNKNEAVQLLAKEFELEPPVMNTIMGENRYTLQLDDQLAADMDELGAFMKSLNRLPEAPKARDWIDPAPLRAVHPALVRLK